MRLNWRTWSIPVLAVIGLAAVSLEARLASAPPAPPLGLLWGAGLLALCLIFPLSLPPVEISLAHASSLSLLFLFGPGPAAVGVLTGALLAAGARQLWPIRRQPAAVALRRLAADINLQATPLALVTAIYLLVGGRFPVTVNQPPDGLRAALLVLTFLFGYQAVLWLNYAARRPFRLTRGEQLTVAALEVLPVPVALYTAVTYPVLGSGLLATFTVALIALALSLHAMSQAQARLRRRAVEQANLYEQAQAKLREHEILSAGRSAVAATLQRRAIYAVIVQQLADITQSQTAALLELARPGAQLDLAYQWNKPGQAARPLPESIATNAYPGAESLLRLRQPLVIRRDAPNLEPQAAARLEAAGMGTLLALPLVVATELAGVIELYNPRPRDFDLEELRLAQLLARQAAAAIANAREFEVVEESRDRLVSVLKSAHEGVIVVDEKGRVTLVNPKLESLLDLSAENVVGRTLLELMDQPGLEIAPRLGFTRDDILELLLTLRAGLALSIPRVEYTLNQSRTRVLERTGAPVLDPLERAIGWVLIVRDVTEEREIDALRADLSNMIIHDLRSPLSAVLISLSLIRDHLPGAARTGIVNQGLDVARRSVERLIDLVNTLLDISRLESGDLPLQRAPLAMRAATEEAIAGLAPLAAEYGLFLINEIPSDLPPALADRDQVGRVLTNLLDNAVKFTPTGGRIRVTARLAADHNRIECAVVDTGPGIPQADRERIFDRFAQVSNQSGRRRGTGLGLAFCALAIDAHGGRIWVDSPPEGGSAFKFTLPLG